MSSPNILEQGQRRREEDKLRISKILQENQQKFELKNYKKMLTITIISTVIALLSLFFVMFSYYGWIPKYENKDITKATQDITIDTHANTDGITR